MTRRTTLTITLCWLLSWLVGSATAGPTATALQAHTAILVKRPLLTWVGNAVYLGGGRILTASHVAGTPDRPSPILEMAGVSLPTTRLKLGRFEDVDLALLQVDEKALPREVQGLPGISVCDDDPDIGTPVLVITPKQISESHIVPSSVIPQDVFPPAVIAKFNTLIADVYSTGNSGSGVFDEKTGCLLGVMSRKIELTRTAITNGYPVRSVIPVAKYYVGPKLVRAFLEGTGTP
jgi:Trypsin-like peptidase domain